MLASAAYFFAVAALAVANPVKRQFTAGEACVFEYTPNTPLKIGSISYFAETNYQFGHYLSAETGNFVRYLGNDAKFSETRQVVNGTITISADTKTDAEVAAILQGLVGKELPGSPDYPTLSWTFNKVDCASA